jgi:hypothetical protein
MANWVLVGPFAHKAILPSDFVNDVDTFLTKVPNWEDGSDHTAANPVILRGALFHVMGEFEADDADITITTGKALTAEAGSTTELHDVRVLNATATSLVSLRGRKQWYRARVTLADADQTVDVGDGDRFNLPANNASPRTITLDHTGVAPNDGESLTFFWNPATAGGGGTQYTFEREDNTIIATFVGAQVADTGAVFAEFEFVQGVGWRLGKHSGTPNEYTPGPDTWTSYGVVVGAGA